MANYSSINSLIDSLLKSLPANYSIESTNNFYTFIENELNHYINKLEEISQEEYKFFLSKSKEMVCSPTKRRFINLAKSIKNTCLKILQNAYRGDVFQALLLLNSLLYKGKFTQYKLSEELVKYFQTSDYDSVYYRCVDFCETEKSINCWHVPFELRQKVSRSRFNQVGYPCFYLASNISCASAEVGKPADGKKRWCGSFKPKKEIFYLDFGLPVLESMNDYEKFSFIISYPLRLLCLTKAKNNEENFCEEYLFSQLFFHLLFMHRNDQTPRFDGIKYVSTHDRNAMCFVIPALYNSISPPLYGFSHYITSLFIENMKPIVIMEKHVSK